MPKKDPLAEIARIMSEPYPDTSATIPDIPIGVPFDMSGSMAQESRGGTSFTSVFERLHQTHGEPSVSEGLDRVFDRLVNDGEHKRMHLVFTDGTPFPGAHRLADQPRETSQSMDGDLKHIVRLDHSGATPDGKPMREGFWRSEAEPDLPEPVVDMEWADRDRFIERLGQLEAQAKSVSFRGFSTCRICGCRNGSKTLKLGAWEWPSGYMHYVREHGVRPSPSFEMFVNDAFVRIR